MARPRVFVSSTYYDLKHIRSSLELFIESLGFEPILSEKGDIAYLPDSALDESCYREAGNADIFVLVVGGRYGSEASQTEGSAKKRFFEQYESITRKEFDTAYDADVPIFILIDSNVNSEYQTYLRNRDSAEISYAHVDSVNVFRFVDFLHSKRRNNPVFQFERSAQIETWLKDQWAGLFRELLKSRSQQRQLVALTSQVGELRAINGTLKHYLEEVLSNVAPDTSDKLIKAEEKRLSAAKTLEALQANDWFRYIKDDYSLDDDGAEKMIASPNNAEEALSILLEHPSTPGFSSSSLAEALKVSPEAQKDFNDARSILGLPQISFKNPEAKSHPRRKRTLAKTSVKSEE